MRECGCYPQNMAASLITTDARGRATLGPKAATYKSTDLGDGVLLLEPARVLTDVEIAVLGTPGLLDQINTSMRRPDEGRAATRRSARA